MDGQAEAGAGMNGRRFGGSGAEPRRFGGSADRRIALFVSLLSGAWMLLPKPAAEAQQSHLVDKFPSQRVALVNAASASGDFIAALSKKNRIIVTATRSGGEKNETVFGEYFAAAYAGDVADADKDGTVSLLEAFEYARREV